ncbi:MAG: RNA 2',3'-cyclic phosphodiesterase [Desulfobulbaceae bacterium]|jgi:2'-5' RNA ligase|nr:RNA 2',3'-cyclic phosphodiesterase [Desulfobulbaceae bacterium]MDY0350191.1 RNA 2',3'-cyclic phosphodiesterase [Desulfobulbaceae bacterium]
MPRLFVAIDLPARIKEQLSALSCGLPGARWIAPEQMHLTVRFIGEVDSRIFQRVREALTEVRGEPFPLRLEGIGFFPPRGHPRVVWVGIRRSDELVRLRKRIESILVRSGLEPEGRKYSPHITLARLNNTPGSRIGAYLAHNGLFRTEEFTVREFNLYSSVLNNRGARHYIEQEYPLDQ